MRYSVIIPTVGRQSLGDAVDSVRAQDPPADQIIVVADGHEIVGRVHALIAADDPRVAVLSIDRHGAPAPARNAGLEIVRTPLVALLDDDDVWHPHKMAEQLTLFEDDVVAVGANATVVGDGPARPYFDRCRRRLTLRHFLLRNPLITSTVTARTDALVAVGGFPEHPFLLDDYSCWLRLATRGHFAVVDSPLIDYRAVNETSSSSRVSVVHGDPVAACLRDNLEWSAEVRYGRSHRVGLRSALVVAVVKRWVLSIRRGCGRLRRRFIAGA